MDKKTGDYNQWRQNNQNSQDSKSSSSNGGEEPREVNNNNCPSPDKCNSGSKRPGPEPEVNPAEVQPALKKSCIVPPGETGESRQLIDPMAFEDLQSYIAACEKLPVENVKQFCCIITFSLAQRLRAYSALEPYRLAPDTIRSGKVMVMQVRKPREKQVDVDDQESPEQEAKVKGKRRREKSEESIRNFYYQIRGSEGPMSERDQKVKFEGCIARVGQIYHCVRSECGHTGEDVITGRTDKVKDHLRCIFGIKFCCYYCNYKTTNKQLLSQHFQKNHWLVGTID